MTSSHQGRKIAEAFWRRLWLKQVHLSSGLFVFIGVHSWFVFINDRPFSSNDPHGRAGVTAYRDPHSLHSSQECNPR